MWVAMGLVDLIGGGRGDLDSNPNSALASWVNFSHLSLFFFVICKMGTDKIKFLYRKQKTQITVV